MRRIISVLVIGLCISAADSTAPASDRDFVAGADISAAKKKKQTRHVDEREAAPAVAARRPWMDPSFGPDGRLYPNPYPPGTCSVDQGYGRFSTCDFHE